MWLRRTGEEKSDSTYNSGRQKNEEEWRDCRSPPLGEGRGDTRRQRAKWELYFVKKRRHIVGKPQKESKKEISSNVGQRCSRGRAEDYGKERPNRRIDRRAKDPKAQKKMGVLLSIPDKIKRVRDTSIQGEKRTIAVDNKVFESSPKRKDGKATTSKRED